MFYSANLLITVDAVGLASSTHLCISTFSVAWSANVTEEVLPSVNLDLLFTAYTLSFF